MELKLQKFKPCYKIKVSSFIPKKMVPSTPWKGGTVGPRGTVTIKTFLLLLMLLGIN
jgi:hypothetical protein